MTCHRLAPNVIVCTTPHGRLHVGNRYVYVEFHPYCGPSFFKDQGGCVPYDPVDEDDPVWPEFEKWHTKYKAQTRAQRVV